MFTFYPTTLEIQLYILVYSSRSFNSSERSRIRSATVESAERDYSIFIVYWT